MYRSTTSFNFKKMNNLTNSDINLIERRLDNLLSEPELQSFNERLRFDSDFKEGFESYQDAVFAVYLAGEADVRAILKAEQAKMNTSNTYSTDVKSHEAVSKPDRSLPVLRGMRSWLAAASIAVLGVAIYWIAFKNNDNTPEKLLAAYYKPKINTLTKSLRDGEESKKQRQIAIDKYGEVEGIQLFNALSLYDNGAYEQAAKSFNALHLQNDTLYLYQANALLMADKAKEAIAVLDRISPTSQNYREAQWYSAMANLKLKNIAKTKEILRGLATEGNKGYQAKSKDLLERLE
jgi:hypothetical protein